MGAPLVIKLDKALKNIPLVAFDTSPIIYFVEANPNYDALITEIFRRVDDGEISGLTSVITLCEVLIHPIRQQNQLLKQSYLDILRNSPNFFTESIDATIAETAAKLRAKYNLRTPDALQIATA